MIAFHGTNLVQRELCELLCLTVPEEFHIPVIFTTRRSHDRAISLTSSGEEVYPLGYHHPGGTGGPRIIINLSPIYAAAFMSATALCTGSSDFRVWKALLDTCYHEFGHVATGYESDHVTSSVYERRQREYHYVENLAETWAHRKVMELAGRDTRLAQPTVIRGYLGARLCHARDMLFTYVPLSGRALAEYVRDRRCYKTRTQLTSGDVLTYLGCQGGCTSGNYRALRRVSREVGTDYWDAAGRHHKLYSFGDLTVLARRLSLTMKHKRLSCSC